MMDRISVAVLDKICSLAPLGRYVIISEDEFFDNFPEDSEKSDTELKKALRTLVSGGFIELRYSSGNLYCAAPLKKYEPEPEPLPSPCEKTVETVYVKEEPKKKRGFLSFLAAFCGGALGSVIAGLIAAVFIC